MGDRADMVRDRGRLFAAAAAAALALGCGGRDTGPSDALHDDGVGSICEEVPCRPGTRVIVPLGRGQHVETTVRRSPYVERGEVSILPGETILVELDFDGGEIGTPRYVPEASLPDRTLRLSLGVDDPPSGLPRTLLRVQNDLDRAVSYEAGAMSAEEWRLVAVSTCPVGAGSVAFEVWPFPALEARLRSFRLVDPEEPLPEGCE